VSNRPVVITIWYSRHFMPMTFVIQKASFR